MSDDTGSPRVRSSAVERTLYPYQQDPQTPEPDVETVHGKTGTDPRRMALVAAYDNDLPVHLVLEGGLERRDVRVLSFGRRKVDRVTDSSMQVSYSGDVVVQDDEDGTVRVVDFSRIVEVALPPPSVVAVWAVKGGLEG